MYKNIDFDEEVFIPFMSDCEDDGLGSLQLLWRGDDVFKQINADNENEE